MNNPMKLERSAVAYLRVGASGSASAAAIEMQRAGCYRIAAKHGLKIVREYVEVGRPAPWDEQWELQRLVRDLLVQRDAAYVVVWDFARLAFDLAQLDLAIIRIRACGAEITTIPGMDAAARFIDQQDN
jgi:DNA invertase Pin-like site-specific DNA recombinase